MRNRVALLACLVSLPPALASAQTAGAIVFTESSTTSAGGLDDEVINIAECNGTVADSLTLRWTWGVTTLTTTNYYRIYASTSACPTSGAAPTDGPTIQELTTGFQQVPASSTGGSGPTAINVRTGLVQELTSLTCAADATINFCVLVFDSNANASTVQNGAGASGALSIDATVPSQPTSVSVTSGDGALTVRWVPGAESASTWLVKASPAAADPALNCPATGTAGEKSCSGSATTECRITGLTNGACYSVTVQGFSAVNNPSAVSEAVTGTPAPVDDFWETYQRAGGVEEGGCSSGSASALALLVLAMAAPRLRRRRP